MPKPPKEPPKATGPGSPSYRNSIAILSEPIYGANGDDIRDPLPMDVLHNRRKSYYCLSFSVFLLGNSDTIACMHAHGIHFSMLHAITTLLALK